mgnify:CR=1 FL=1
MKTQLLQGLNDGESDRDLVELVLVRLQEPNEEIALISSEAKQINILLKEQRHSFQQELARQEQAKTKA